jgi:hypothetical protein
MGRTNVYFPLILHRWHRKLKIKGVIQECDLIGIFLFFKNKEH